MVFSKIILSCRTKKSRIVRRDDRKSMNLEADGDACSRGSVLGKRKTRRWRVEPDNNNVQKITGENGVSDRNGETDRISELPESIIHQIFTFLRCSKDVARTTVLSKHWRSMFNSYHSFDFDQKWFRVRREKGKLNRIKTRKVQEKRFKRYVDQSIATRLDPLVSIDKFSLSLDFTMSSACIAGWLRTAIDKNVKELVIQERRGGFLLPKDVVESSSLISLKLSGYILCNFYSIKLCNLRELSIKDCGMFDAFVLEKFEQSCPLLEDLRLVCCPEILHLAISSLVKLRRVEVQDCARLNRIEISGSDHLESFWYHAKKNQRCKIDLRDTGNLKILTLKDRIMTNSAFEDWILKCPLLEKLVLHECYRLEKVKIFSGKLKSLALIKCEKLSEVNIDAPNLYSLEYSGPKMPFRSLDASRLCRAKFSFSSMWKTKPHSWWNFGHQNVFGDFDRFKGLKLILYLKLEMKIFEEPSEAPLDGNNFEKVELTASSAGIVKTVDYWLRECRGKSLILASTNSELIKLTSAMIMDGEDNPSCCKYYSNKCWRHYIEGVKVSNSEIGNKTCYDFTWRSRKS